VIDFESVVQSFELLGAFDGIKGVSLILGMFAVASGVFLFLNHRRHLTEVMSDTQNKRILAFEVRKYRRRTTISAMITSTGFMLAALNWVNEPRVFTVFIMMILGLLLGILVIAVFDLFLVGLQQIATPDPRSQKAMIEAFLKQREEVVAQAKVESNVEVGPEGDHVAESVLEIPSPPSAEDGQATDENGYSSTSS
jgi:hypothetical protein